jgi:plastocyanin
MTLFRGSALALALLPTLAMATDEPVFKLTIKDHRFDPAELSVPAGERVKLVIENQDAKTEEFESRDMHVEKLVKGGKSITVFVGPLKPGSYHFFGERHEDTALGTLTAK